VGYCLGFISFEIISEDEQLHLLDLTGCCDYNANCCIRFSYEEASKQAAVVGLY
jgi:hypothetical protein